MKATAQRSIESIYGLSPMQRGMLFHSLYESGTGAYFQQVTAVLRGALDFEAFQGAWRGVVERHPILRSAFVWEKLDQPVQAVHREVELPIRRLDWSGLGQDARRERFEELLDDERRAGFDLTEAPLMRLFLIAEGEERHRLLWSYHHLLLDGWSLALVLQEVFASYQALRSGSAPALPPARSYRDYIGWLKQQDPGAAEAFWREAMAGFREPTPLGVDYRTELGNRGSSYRELRTLLSEEATRSLEAMARDHQLTLSVVVQGAWSLLLGRYGDSREVVFGNTVSGRPSDLAGVESMVGLFINTLPQRVRIDPAAPLATWLSGIRERQVAMADFEHTPLPDIQGVSEVGRGVPLFDSILVFENYPVDPSSDLAGGPVEVEDLRYIEQTHYPLTVLAVPGERLSLGLAFDAARLEPETVERMLGHFRRILEGFAETPDGRVGDIEMLAPAELDLALQRAVKTGPVDRCAHQIFEACTERAPDAPAVIADDAELSYGELNRRADRLAHCLIGLGVVPGDRVGICLERSSRMIVALLGVLKSGAAYLPLDPAYPRERLGQMLTDAAPRVVVVDAGSHDRLEGLETRRIDVEGDDAAGATAEGPSVAVGPEDPAYVIYTSGSTGEPKGVMVSHRSLVRYTLTMIEEMEIGAGDRFLEFAPLTFDASVVQIFPTLLSGAALGVHSRVDRLSNVEVVRLCGEWGITVLDLPAAFWHQWLDDLTSQGLMLEPPLRYFLTGGESSFKDQLRTWAELAPPGSGFLTSYGPTETTVAATVFTTDTEGVEDLEADRVPIGRALPHAAVYLLGRDLRPVPVGVTGRVYVGGEGVSRGYLGVPRLTAQRFLPDPFASEPGARLYATGDLARLAPDGNLEFRGREDGQVKVRGFRIELPEVETAVTRHPAVREAVVTTLDRAGGKDLVAYVVADDDADLDPDALREAVAERLPDFMVPAFFVPLDEIPVSRNGKIDRDALPALEVSRPSGEGEPVAPQTEIEQVLAEIWSGVLEIDGVGRHDDFFALGGHSLSATQLVSRIRAYFQVDLPLATLFEHPTVAGVAREVEAALVGDGAAGRLDPVEAGDRSGDEAPLSLSQERLWFLDQFDPGNSVYNLPVLLRLHGALSPWALQGGLEDLVGRHESLRTLFVRRGDEPVQRIDPPGRLPMPVVDLSRLDGAMRAREMEELARREARRPFSLERGPLFRARLLRLAADDHLLLVTMHHIVSDGWSMGILIREVAALYEARLAGEPSPLAPLPVQYRDFARWQRRMADEDRFAESIAYWERKLADPPGPLALPSDRPRPARQRFDGARERRVLDPEATERLEAAARRERATLFMVLLSAFEVLLYRYTGQTDLLVGSPVANRTQENTEGLIGFFLNTLALRTELSGSWTFRHLLESVRETSIGSYAHQDVPFELLLEILQPERELSAPPLFQVLFNMQNFGAQSVEAPGLTLESLEPLEHGSKFDLTLFAESTAEGLHLDLVYSTQLFERETARRMLKHLERVLRAVVENPKARLAHIPLLGERERTEVAAAPPTADPARFPDADLERPVGEIFRRRAAQRPERPAVRGGDRTWTYGRLDREADDLARRILERRGRGEERIALLLPHGPLQAAGMLGVLRSGKTYVPLDPAYPVRRLEQMVADSRAAALVTAPGQRALAEDLAGEGLDVLEVDPEREAPAGPPVTADVSPDSPAYILYTSGSTGRPKGAIQSRRNLLHHIRCYTNNLGLRQDDRLLQVASYSFDAAVMDVYGALLNGATLCPYDVRERGIDGLGAMVRREGVTVYHSTPTVYRYFLDSLDGAGDRFPSVRLVVLGGEEVVPRDIDRHRRHFGDGCVFVNGYGPTESTLCLQYAVDPERGVPGTRVPIGHPVQETEVVLLDEAGDELADVGVGELAIRSRYLVLGYWDRPEQNRAAFRADEEDPELRTYRTGDLGRRRFDGAFEYLGRIDSQIKVRGVRVETGEVEAALVEHPAVREGLVVADTDARGETRLVGYVVADGAVPEDLELRRFLAERLPDAMVPSCFVAMEAFPLTPTGKIQRRDLPPPPERTQTVREHRPPRDPVEEIVASLWAEVLGRDEISVDDDFFGLGGHSLLATQVVSRLESRFEIDFPLRRLFEGPTVEEVAAAVRRLEEGGAPVPPRIERVPDGTDVPLSFAQQRLWFLEQIDPDTPASTPGNPASIPAAVELEGPLDHAALEASLNEVVRRHEALRTVFVRGQDGPVQRTLPTLHVEVPLEDLAEIPETERRERAIAMAVEDPARPFDLRNGPLLRARLLRLGEDHHMLLFLIHHIVSDGWSMGVLVGELATLYRAFSRGQPSPLPELPIQYKDFAAWQRRAMTGEVLESHLEYWRSQLGEQPPTLRLARHEPEERSNRGERLSFELSERLTDRLRALSRDHGVTLFMTLLAVYQTLLYRLAGQEEFLVGTAVANRNRQEVEPLIGFFVNMLPLRADLAGRPRFVDVLERARRVTLDSYAHQDLPFEKLVKELAPDRDLDRHPLFQVFFGMLDMPGSDHHLNELRMERLDLDYGFALFDLSLFMVERDGALRGTWIYSPDLFDEAPLRRMLVQLRTLLESVVAEPKAPIDRLRMLSPVQRRQVVEEWNDTRVEYGGEPLLHELVGVQARRTPDRVAVVDGERTLSYRALDERAGAIARRLREMGVGPEVRVGVCLERSPEMVAVLLGVAKAGGAYVPLDPSHPAERLAYTLGDAGARVLLTERRLQGLVSVHGVEEVFVEDLPAAGATGAVPTSPENLAYVIYTSGSTGRPKGVMVPHRAICNFLGAMGDRPGLDESDVLLSVTTVSFDIVALELFLPLVNGARVVVADAREASDPLELARVLERSGATVAQATPATWQMLREVGWEGAPALRALCGGEALPAELAEFVRGTTAGLWNLYGPTETAVWSTAHPVGEGEAPVSIGRPIANTRVYVLDERMEPVPPGVAGELFIGGEGVARGYRGRPALTAEQFVPDPFAAGERLYRTGDRVSFDPYGRLEFGGRLDHQIKIRGFRIEPGEIEHHLQSHPDVGRAVVAVDEPRPGDRRLTAYVVPDLEPASAASEPDRVSLEAGRERLDQWRRVYEETYAASSGEAADSTFNTAGWNSSYTGEPISAEEMEEWVHGTVRRVSALRPRRVLEIGCGTGLLLHRVAPRVDEYWGTDFSEVALSQVRARLDEGSVPPGSRVELVHGPAHDLDALGDRTFDLVILNSVAQYFPGLDYFLDVIDQAVRHTAPGGALFLGDLRDHRLQRASQTSVELAHAPPELDVATLRDRVERQMEREEELLLAPDLFPELRRRIPRIGRVAVELRRGEHRNEVTAFRYDAILHLDREEALRPFPVRSWDPAWPDLEPLRRLLEEERPEGVRVEAVPNARVVETCRAVRLLEQDGAPETVDRLRDALADGSGPAIDPEAVWRMAEAAGYEARVTWSDAGLDRVDLWLRRHDVAAEFDVDALDGRPLDAYANDPLLSFRLRSLPRRLRTFLDERVPRWMVPARFSVIEELPLTPNGKVDRNALPELDRERVETMREYVAPRNELERELARVWADVLGVDRVGVHDNFFRLGGDSILSVQVVTRLRDVEIELTPRQMFEHQTVAEQAEVALRDRPVRAPQGPVEGVVALAPDQLRLIELAPHRLDRWTQAVLLAGDGELDATALERALEALVEQHDALRHRFERGDSWTQRCSASGDGCLRFTREDLSATAPEELASEISRRAERARGELDLERGPLLRAVRMEWTGGWRLLLVVHELVVDAASWRILLEDLHRAYRQAAAGEVPDLGPKTTSFQEWTERLGRHAADEAVRDELFFWQDQARPELVALPRDRDGENLEGTAREVETNLGAEVTRDLLERAPEAYNNDPSEIVLTALAQAVAEGAAPETGDTRGVLVELESPGRDGLFDDLDPSRTVGRLAARYPVRLAAGPGDAPGEALKRTKETLRRVPGGGTGYGILRRLGDETVVRELAEQPEPEVAFRFRGRTEGAADGGGAFRPAPEDTGSARPSDAPRSRPLDVDAFVSDGRLLLRLVFSEALHDPGRIERLAERVRERLLALVDHCLDPEAGDYTPTDFPMADLDEEQLGAILEGVEFEAGTD